MQLNGASVMFSVQIDIDVLVAARAVTLSHTARHDADMLLKTTLTEALGGAVVRPWSLHRQLGSVASVIGYSAIPIGEIETRLQTSLPSVRVAIKALHGHALPELELGQKFRFSVRLCPTIRVTPSKDKSHAHGEQDAFLVFVQRGETNIEREGVYTRYLAERLSGATVEQAKLTRFQLLKMTRPHRGRAAPESGLGQRVTPDAVLEGVLTVTEPAAFKQTLMQGIGRQRAYGRGYVRLEATRVSAGA
jgi:CRISPR system Cascade subunit CasE